MINNKTPALTARRELIRDSLSGIVISHDPDFPVPGYQKHPIQY